MEATCHQAIRDLMGCCNAPAPLTDLDIAVVSYVRRTWGNGGAVFSDVQVGRLRGTPIGLGQGPAVI